MDCKLLPLGFKISIKVNYTMVFHLDEKEMELMCFMVLVFPGNNKNNKLC